MLRRIALILSIAALSSTAAPSLAFDAADFTAITGATANDTLGLALASGDFNGDGYDDVVVGSANGQSAGIEPGLVYIIYGGDTAPASGSIAEQADATYVGEANFDWAGQSVGSGDFDGDGYDDIVVGAIFNDSGISDAGAAYVIYGQASQLTGGNLSSNIRITGASTLDQFGVYVSGVGDLNNDGLEELMISATGSDINGSASGTVYLLYGQSSDYSAGVVSATRFVGDTAGDAFGALTAPAGDLNGDGYDDAIIGASGVDSPGNNAGAMYIIYGQASAYTNPSVASSAFVRLTGEAADDTLGYVGQAVGDIDQDGYDDLIIGSPYYSSSTGAIYVFYGSSSNITPGSVSQGIRITGYASGDQFGNSIQSAGDLTSNGGNDLLVGVPYTDQGGTNAGQVSLLWNDPANRFTAGNIDAQVRSDYNGTAGTGAFGYAITMADINGDGYSEAISSAPYSDTTGTDAGTVYIGYLAIDLDNDGSLSEDGIAIWSSDCNDSDSTVSSDQTYYLDEDGDGLGASSGAIEECLGIAPDGYANNDNDTNDEVRNSGIEISGDEIDNDGDDEIDEPNTISENGRHPEYKHVDPNNKAAVNAAIVRVRSTQRGKLWVKYADDSVYVYNVFNGTPHKKLQLKRYPRTGYYAVMQKSGKKIAVVNILTARKKIDTQNLPGITYSKHHLQFSDLRSNDKQDLIVVSKDGTNLRLFVTEVNLNKRRFKYDHMVDLNLPGIQLNQTNIVGNTIDLRSSRQVLASFFVDSRHHLIQL